MTGNWTLTLELPLPAALLDGNCRDTDPETFFALAGQEAAAKAVCRNCHVRALCLDWALEAGMVYGIWGGLTEKERRNLKRAVATA